MERKKKKVETESRGVISGGGEGEGRGGGSSSSRDPSARNSHPPQHLQHHAVYPPTPQHHAVYPPTPQHHAVYPRPPTSCGTLRRSPNIMRYLPRHHVVPPSSPTMVPADGRCVASLHLRFCQHRSCCRVPSLFHVSLRSWSNLSQGIFLVDFYWLGKLCKRALLWK